jgi:hypothetical protein
MPHPEGPFAQSRFDHRQHLRFAWTVLSELPPEEAGRYVATEIHDFAQAHAPGKYHEPLTQFWVTLVQHTRSLALGATGFGSHLERFPMLLNSSLVRRHYSAALLASELAKEKFVAPDLAALP